jgi:DNA invertase Pin-like site-specific DNA recombinase
MAWSSFNSLDNQREASEAYVKSQAHEGWKLVRAHYDDGGYSGGSMDRPALKKLLDDISAHRRDRRLQGRPADPLARRALPSWSNSSTPIRCLSSRLTPNTPASTSA